MFLARKTFSALTKANKKFIIYTGKFSAVKLRGKTFRSKKIKHFYNFLLACFGNESAEMFAKAALELRAPHSHSLLSYSDLK